MTRGIHGMSSIAQQGILLPQESVLEVSKMRQDLFIGIPKEITFQEHRIPLVPSAVGLLVSNGHRVLIETGDSLDSINATASSIVRYVSQKAGIGIGAGRISTACTSSKDSLIVCSAEAEHRTR